MIERYCPSCDTQLNPSNMNLSEGVALCPSCGSLTRLGDLVGANQEDTGSGRLGFVGPGGTVVGGSLLEDDWRDMPRGCKVSGYHSDATLTASARSWGGAMGLLFITLFWNGITSTFVVIMISGFYKHFGGTIPAWAKGSPFDGGGKDMSLGMCFFLLLFLTPFMLIGAGMFIMTLMAMLGDVKVHLRGDQASASTGIGPLRWTSRFKASEVRNVHIGQTKWQQNDRHKPLIVIKASTDIRFGSSLSERRMRWLASATRLLLLHPGSEDVSDMLASSGRQQGF